MAAALGRFSAVLLAVASLSACTFWSSDLERLVDQTGRDFKIDPDKHYKEVDLSAVIANPTSYKLMDIRFMAIVNRHDEQVYTSYYTTFRQEDYNAFSVWPAEAPLWESGERLRSVPTLFMRKDNPYIQRMIDTRKFALVDVRARVMGDYDQLPWIEVYYCDEVASVVYTDQSLADYREGMDAYAKNVPATAIAKLEVAVKSPLAPRTRVRARLVLGRLYEARNDYEHAAMHYDLVLADDENNREAWEGLERCQKMLQKKHEGEPAPAKKRKYTGP